MKTTFQIGKRFLGVATILILLVGIPVAVWAATNSGDVSGTITYTGTITGTQTIYVSVHSHPGAPPSVPPASLTNPGGAYTVPGVADGTYYVSAYMDLDGSGGEPGSDEPMGWYDVDGDGNPDTITVSGSNVTGVDISFGNHTPQITSMDGMWEQLGEAVSPTDSNVQQIDLAFYSESEHNTPAVLYSSPTGTTLMKWDGGPDQQWEAESGSDAPNGQNYVSLVVNTFGGGNFPYAAYTDPSSYYINVKQYNDATHTWTLVGNPDFSSPASAYSIDMRLKRTGAMTPVVAFRDSGSRINVMTLSNTWEYIGAPLSMGVNDVELALDSTDAPWVVYHQNSSSSIGAIAYISSTWEYVGGSVAFQYSATQPSIAIDSSDTAYVAFKNTVTNKLTVMKHSNILTETWQTVGTAGFSACSSANPQIVIDAADTPYVAFESDCDDGITVMKYSGAGSSGWELVGSAGFSEGTAQRPVINFNNNNIPFVAYISTANAYPAWPAYVRYFDAHPTITQTTVTMSEDASPTPFALSLRGEDEDGNALSWSIAGQGSHGTAAIAGTIGSSGTVTATLAYTPVANFNGEDSFIVQLDDGTATSTATVQITIEPTNDAPTAYFANRTVAQGETVMLDGTLSHDIDGDTLSDFHWTQTGGTSVSFTDNISRPTFVAPSLRDVLTFTLAVTDPGGLSDDHSGTVWVVGGDASTLVPTDTDTIFAPPTAPFTLTVPVGGVHQPISLIFTDTVGGYSPPVDRQFAGSPFSLAAYADGIEQTGFNFAEPFTITIHYSDDDISGLSESTLDLRYWNGSDWVSDGIVLISRDPANNQITFTVNHLTDFALIAEERYFVYLPLVLK